jgi:ribonuclease R
LNSLLLRAMKQATYDIVNIGHFGLASKAYLHFTSPIRRYPDLVVHRAVHRICQGKSLTSDFPPRDSGKSRVGDRAALVPSGERDAQTTEALKEAALQASLAERKAMDVEREVVDLHRALLMRTRIGDELEGSVSAVVGSGLFVALDAPYVDVLVKFEQLGSEPYEMDEEGLAAVGKRSGETIHLGDRMKVRVDDVSITRRQIYGTRIRTGDEDATSQRPMKRGEGRGKGGAFGRRDPHGKKAAEAQAKKRAKKEERRAKQQRSERAGKKPKRRR